ncbi:hypothetical protein AUQ48_11690 [Kocuria flava]|uniref:Uncharacterized protein n=1 Tax=Kocuria flava TaxID=446860 RepID=A0A2N4T3F6_9MICC|nr:hypothetical protein [Kocuria flava]PLC12759.1 hypothetical protein AUQ48_11690 [Kocuria flava]
MSSATPRSRTADAGTALHSAEEALRRARRTYARRLLGLVADALAERHPEAVRLDVRTVVDGREHVADVLRDARGEYVWGDPGRVVVVRETADDALGGPVTVAVHDARDLVLRALEVHDGPLEELLRHDPADGTHWMPLRRG